MKSMTFKRKQLVGSLSMVFLVMIASAIVVSMVIYHQNKSTAYSGLEKSLHIIRDELLETREKLLDHSRQTATINDMGGRVTMAMGAKKNAFLLSTYLRAMATDLVQIGIAGNLWKIAIYDLKGELMAFTVKKDGGELLLGFNSDPAKGSLSGVTLKQGRQIEGLDWKELKEFQDPEIKLKFDGTIPQEEKISFVVIEKGLCLKSYAPITTKTFDPKTKKYESKYVGFAVGIRKLDQSFANRFSRLTGMKINFFTKEGFILGDLKAYKSLDTREIKQIEKNWHLEKATILLNDCKLKSGVYFQGVLPIYGDSRFLGAIAALQSADMIKANTWQVVRLLGLVYIACILLIIPFAVALSKSLVRPILTIINTLTATSQKVYTASDQVSTASGQQAEGASEQAASLEETSSSLEEISSTTRKNADSAKEADTLTKEANQIVGQADGSMSQLKYAMDEISKASEETSKIIKTIDEIAFQTNLLALNAAVEAARAGEAGAGFAVVADEVRNLAMRAADAAKNTAALIEETVKKVEAGTGLVGKTAKAFAQVSESSRKIGELSGEIAASSGEQARGIEQVTHAVTEMDEVVQRNAASAEQSASASRELSAEAAQMKQVVDDLMALVGGHRILKNKLIPFGRKGGHEPVSEARPETAPALKGAGTQKADPVPVEKVPPEQIISLKESDEDFTDF